MANRKALITDDIHPFLQEQLIKNGFEVDVIVAISKSKLLAIINNYEIVVVTTYLIIDEAIINAATKLQVIARVGSGLENIATNYATQKGIHVANSPEGNANAVAEHTLMLLLCCMNKLIPANQSLKQQLWQREQHRGEELDGKTIGIIGFGNTGTAFAKKLQGFDVRILFYDILQKDEIYNAQPSTLSNIQQACEIISWHVPYTPKTHHYINKEFISQCRKNPILINTSRGSIMDTMAVYNALIQQQINGLGIDVFEDEPITKDKVISPEVYQQLIKLPNVVATPHIAGWTEASKYRLVAILWNKISAILTE